MKFATFLKRDANQLSIKFLFDHIRNIGLCALLFAVANKLYSGDSTGIDSWVLSPQLNSIFLAGFALILMFANTAQFLVVSFHSETNIDRVTHVIMMLIFTVWMQMSLYSLVMVQVARFSA